MTRMLTSLIKRLNNLRDSACLITRTTVLKGGATIAKAILIMVCARQWNMKLILRVS